MSQDKDDLARLLGEMADGEHADHDDHSHEEHHDNIHEPPPTPSPTPTPTPPPKSIAPVAKTPTPPPKPATPPTPKPPVAAKPPPSTPPRPPPTARPPVKPALPPRATPAPAPAPKPAPSVQQPRPAPRPIIHTEPPATPAPDLPTPQPTPDVISDEEQPERYTGTDDDAVIVPALAPTELAKPHAPPPRRQHLSQKLYFKQTIIPILLTLALICIIIPLLGLLSSQTSPFKSLAEPYFLATFWPLGLAFLTFAILTMLAVRKQLPPPTPPTSS